MRYAVGTFALFVGMVALVPARGSEPTEREFLEKLEVQIRSAVQVAAPAVACIIVSRSELYPRPAKADDTPGKLGGFDRAEFLKGAASIERLRLANRLDLSNPDGVADHTTVGGVTIDRAGLVLTPYHAIEGATKLYVFLPRKAGAGSIGSYANVYAADARSDLAVLKLIHPPEGLQAIAFADVQTEGPMATVFPGKLVGLMANLPASGFGPGGTSFFYGGITSIRSRFGRSDDSSVRDSLYLYGRFLEYRVKPRDERPGFRTKGLNPADDRAPEATTGGAIINLDGEMIGLTTATGVAYDHPIGPGYALPMDANARRIVEVLRKGEEVDYGFLGISLDKNSPEIIKIDSVTPYSSAYVAGLRHGEVVVAIDGKPAANYQDLLLLAGNALAGAEVKLDVLGRREPVKLVLGKFKNTQPYIASVRPDPVFGLRVDYLSMLLQQGGQQLPLGGPGGPGPRLPIVRGVCVREISPDSPAAIRFKTLGDNPAGWIITHVNAIPVNTPAEFYAAAKGQEKVKLNLRDLGENRRELTLP